MLKEECRMRNDTMGDILEQLIMKAVESVSELALPASDFKLDNLTTTDKERLLWYLIQTYEEVAKDDILRCMIIEASNKELTRHSIINDFLLHFFSDVLAAKDAKEAFKAAKVNEDETEKMLEYVLKQYEAPWEDEEFLRGVALLARREKGN